MQITDKTTAAELKAIRKPKGATHAQHKHGRKVSLVKLADLDTLAGCEGEIAFGKLDGKKFAALAMPEPKAPTATTGKPVGEMAKLANALVADQGLDGEEAAKRLHKSSVQHPVEAMWALCEETEGQQRKHVIAAAVSRGIAFYTARTQYQLWKSAGAKA